MINDYFIINLHNVYRLRLFASFAEIASFDFRDFRSKMLSTITIMRDKSTRGFSRVVWKAFEWKIVIVYTTTILSIGSGYVRFIFERWYQIELRFFPEKNRFMLFTFLRLLLLLFIFFFTHLASIYDDTFKSASLHGNNTDCARRRHTLVEKRSIVFRDFVQLRHIQDFWPITCYFFWKIKKTISVRNRTGPRFNLVVLLAGGIQDTNNIIQIN